MSGGNASFQVLIFLVVGDIHCQVVVHNSQFCNFLVVSQVHRQAEVHNF